MHELAPVRAGDVIAEKYVIDKVLGAGGMGVVVAATHVDLGQRVAIKFLHGEAAKDMGTVERFIREARAAVRIQSEHVARVIDVGRMSGGAPYMVMEYLDGVDLSDEIARRGQLEPEEAVGFLLEAMEAIAEAHALQIVHRDLKPANLFLTNRKDGSRSVKVLDFGISKAVQEADASLTQTSTMLGSPLYMAPEQVRDARSVDTRADIWSLGVILYECLAGTVPFGGETLSGVLAAIIADPPRPLDEVRPELPRAIVSIVNDCLVKDRERRIQNVSDLAARLSDYGPGKFRVSVDRIYSLMGQPRITSADSFAATSAGGNVHQGPQYDTNGAPKTRPKGTPSGHGATVVPLEIPSGTAPSGTSPNVTDRSIPMVRRPWVMIGSAVGVIVLLGVATASLRGGAEAEDAASEEPENSQMEEAHAASPKSPAEAEEEAPPQPEEQPSVLSTPVAASPPPAPASPATPKAKPPSPRPKAQPTASAPAPRPAAPAATPAPAPAPATRPSVDPLEGRH